jgi:hypothetical protein
MPLNVRRGQSLRTMHVAEGKLDSVDDIAAVLVTATKPRQ